MIRQFILLFFRTNFLFLLPSLTSRSKPVWRSRILVRFRRYTTCFPSPKARSVIRPAIRTKPKLPQFPIRDARASVGRGTEEEEAEERKMTGGGSLRPERCMPQFPSRICTFLSASSAAQPTDQGEESVVLVVVVVKGIQFFSLLCKKIWGVKRQKLCLKRGVKKLIVKNCVYH